MNVSNKLFENLGKPTRRGVRHCPKCGILNGTRGIICKNKACDMMFKKLEKSGAKGTTPDAVQIVISTGVQVFSVRAKESSSELRGFVQLPLVQDMDGNLAENVDPVIVIQSARCYVESCNGSLLTVNDNTIVACLHVRSAMMCQKVASCLQLNYSVLASVLIPEDIKNAIAQLAVDTDGAIVHRVSRTVMAVRCELVPQFPLGYLHISFETKKNDSKYRCACKGYKAYRAHDDQPCVHFYCCICAFISDELLAQEFSTFISLEIAAVLGENGSLLRSSNTMEDGLESFDTDVIGDGVEVVINELGQIHQNDSKRQRLDDLSEDTGCTVDNLVQASSALMTLKSSMASATASVNAQLVKTFSQSPNLPSLTRKTSVVSPSKPTVSSSTKAHVSASVNRGLVDESDVNVTFIDWLVSVTERINQTMHYQFPGNPEPLVFHAPQKFFDCLQQRIASGNKKKRLPNHTTTFLRRDALPLGTFTKHTWHITNILHVKQIFDTPQMPLDITRSFVENRDGTYDLYEGQVMPPDHTKYGGHKQAAIRPLELKTYIKVGSTMPDQKEPTPLIIEWIPDILPRSHIGELRIKFEYGHQRNGHLENIVRTESSSSCR